MSDNNYIPQIAEITDIVQETSGESAIRTYRAVFRDKI